MIKELCAVLFILCSPIIHNFDFTYDTQDEFVKGIMECTININAYLPPHSRVITIMSVAQAGLESGWGTSRFAREGNNFYGVIETNSDNPHMKSLRSNILLKKYGRKCESVADYIYVLNKASHFKEYRELRVKQVLIEEVDIDKTVDLLVPFAADNFYTYKIKDTIDYLFENYPNLFGTRSTPL